MAWFRLIRWQNLMIIALTQLLVWWCIILPQHPQVLSTTGILLLTTSTVLIAAAGYAINDYFDIRIDLVNHPDRMVLGKSIASKWAIVAHTAINIVAISLAGIVALPAGHPEWMLVQAGCTLLLWHYSTTLKRQNLTGNLAVSVLTALTILVLFVYEPVMHHIWQRQLYVPAGAVSSLPVWIMLVYAFFAFMLTWAREIVKDMEDIEGDEAGGCVTMPIVHGLRYATRFAIGLTILTILPLLVSAAVLFRSSHRPLGIYVLALLAVPLAAWAFYLGRGPASPAHYRRASTLLKVIMLLGVFSLIVYKISINS